MFTGALTGHSVTGASTAPCTPGVNRVARFNYGGKKSDLLCWELIFSCWRGGGVGGGTSNLTWPQTFDKQHVVSLQQTAAQRVAKTSEGISVNSVAAFPLQNVGCCSCRSQKKPSVLVYFDEMYYAVNSDIIKYSFKCCSYFDST